MFAFSGPEGSLCGGWIGTLLGLRRRIRPPLGLWWSFISSRSMVTTSTTGATSYPTGTKQGLSDPSKAPTGSTAANTRPGVMVLRTNHTTRSTQANSHPTSTTGGDKVAYLDCAGELGPH